PLPFATLVRSLGGGHGDSAKGTREGEGGPDGGTRTCATSRPSPRRSTPAPPRRGPAAWSGRSARAGVHPCLDALEVVLDGGVQRRLVAVPEGREDGAVPACGHRGRGVRAGERVGQRVG